MVPIMASRIVTQLVSDLSGEDIPEGEGDTVEFAYRGSTYRIDLTSAEATAFDSAMAAYIDRATKVGSRATSKRATAGDAKAIRDWARQHGIDVPSRGRIPAEVRAQYESAK